MTLHIPIKCTCGWKNPGLTTKELGWLTECPMCNRGFNRETGWETTPPTKAYQVYWEESSDRSAFIQATSEAHAIEQIENLGQRERDEISDTHTDTQIITDSIFATNRDQPTDPEIAEHICSLCEKQFTGWGNNPEPLLPYKGEPDGWGAEGTNVCCNECNMHKVIPERIKERLIKAGIKKLKEDQ